MEEQTKLELQKMQAELMYIRQNSCDLDTFKEVVKIAVENGLQRVNWGNISFEMRYHPEPMVGPTPLR